MHRRRDGDRDGGGGVIDIARRALDAIVAHARAEVPAECCGLLIGDDRRIDSAHPARNLESSQTRFLIHPRDHFDAIRAARTSERQVVGVYHSHPATPAVPSAADLAEATYVEYVYVIVSLRGDTVDVRLYRLAGAQFQEEQLTTVD